MDHSIKAAELFIEGYNCAQSVAMAFCDVTKMDETEVSKMSSVFGGGIGGLREACGAFNGMVLVLGTLYGYTDPKSADEKSRAYSMVQEAAERFKAEAGSIICREILKTPPESIKLSAEEEKYYKIRPCARMVMLASRILDSYIEEHPVK